MELAPWILNTKSTGTVLFISSFLLSFLYRKNVNKEESTSSKFHFFFKLKLPFCCFFIKFVRYIL